MLKMVYSIFSGINWKDSAFALMKHLVCTGQNISGQHKLEGRYDNLQFFKFQLRFLWWDFYEIE